MYGAIHTDRQGYFQKWNDLVRRECGQLERGGNANQVQSQRGFLSADGGVSGGCKQRGEHFSRSAASGQAGHERGYDYVVYNDEIIIIEPSTREVVYIIEG